MSIPAKSPRPSRRHRLQARIGHAATAMQDGWRRLPGRWRATLAAAAMSAWPLWWLANRSVMMEHPEWLLGLPILAIVVWIARASISGLPKRSAHVATALRSLTVLLLLLALAEAQGLLRDPHHAVLFALDRSASVPEGARAQELRYVRDAVATANSGDRAGTLVFGDSVSMEQLPTAPPKAPDSIRSLVVPDETDLESAMRVGAAVLPKANRRRLVLITDGVETRGSAETAVRDLAGAGIVVDILPILFDRRDDVAMLPLRAPTETRTGESFALTVPVYATEPGPATLQVYRDGQPLWPQGNPVQLEAGVNRFSVDLTQESSGFVRYLAEVSAPNDQEPSNNRAWTAVNTPGTARILASGLSPDEAATLTQIASQLALNLEVVYPDDLPSDPAAYAAIDAVVLSDVPASAIPAPAQAALATAVRDQGTGLMMLGGARAFGLGGYDESPLEALLPVDLKPPPERHFSRVLCLVLDRSGSMSGEKLTAAKSAADGIVQLFLPNDQLGVVVFDDGAQWAHPLGPVDDQSQVRANIARISEGGGTDITKGMELAGETLQKLDHSVRHMLVLSDGQSDYKSALSLALRLRQQGVTTSAVAVGPDADRQLLGDLARAGGGRFYQVDDAGKLAKIFLDETEELRQRALIQEGPVQVTVAAPSEVTLGLAGAPLLRGYVATGRRDRATTPWTTPEGDPLLAHWQAGLGRVLAFTSDAGARWSAPWIGEPGHAEFWGRALRWTARLRSPGPFRMTSSIEGDSAVIGVDAVDSSGRFLSFLDLRVLVQSPGGDASQNVQLTGVGPGRYEARLPIRNAGVYRLDLLGRDPETGLPINRTAAIVRDFPAELQPGANQLAFLRHLAALTGGRILSGDARQDAPFQGAPAGDPTQIPLFAWLVVGALLCFLGDVVLRRVYLSPGDVSAAAALVWNRLRGRRMAQASPLDQLRDRHLERRQRAAPQEKTPRASGISETTMAAAATATPTASVSPSPTTQDSAPAASVPAADTPEEPAADPHADYTRRLLAARQRGRKGDGTAPPQG